jgi:hypothetical protein
VVRLLRKFRFFIVFLWLPNDRAASKSHSQSCFSMPTRDQWNDLWVFISSGSSMDGPWEGILSSAGGGIQNSETYPRRCSVGYSPFQDWIILSEYRVVLFSHASGKFKLAFLFL